MKADEKRSRKRNKEERKTRRCMNKVNTKNVAIGVSRSGVHRVFNYLITSDNLQMVYTIK